MAGGQLALIDARVEAGCMKQRGPGTLACQVAATPTRRRGVLQCGDGPDAAPSFPVRYLLGHGDRPGGHDRASVAFILLRSCIHLHAVGLVLGPDRRWQPRFWRCLNLLNVLHGKPS